eukprot:284129-Pelagomonas_calceolata.AAC.2
MRAHCLFFALSRAPLMLRAPATLPPWAAWAWLPRTPPCLHPRTHNSRRKCSSSNSSSSSRQARGQVGGWVFVRACVCVCARVCGGGQVHE